MTAILAWLAGTHAGRWAASLFAAALVAAGVLWRAYNAGQQAEVSRHE